MELRMSDQERQLIGISKLARQKVIDQLKFSYANDYLDEHDFEKRMELATNTNSREILKELVDDLPAMEESGSSERQTHESRVHINDGLVKESGTLVGFFSGVSRKGQWHPPRNLKIVAVMGGVDLDFSEAEIPPGGMDIDVFCLMGGIDLRVPEGINVDAHPVAIMGGVDHHGNSHYGNNAPTIRVRGFVLMGGVDVKPPKKKFFRKFLKNLLKDD